MKVSYNWLREFVDIPVSAEVLAERLSLSGLEVAGVEEALPDFDARIVVGEILAVRPHPDADKLVVCDVNPGGGDAPLQIVCGAPNAAVGLRAPLALPGAKLPDGSKIRKSRLRGVESEGMLCSGRELGLGEDHSGLLPLPADAPAGKPLREYLVPDRLIEIEITPNRGDCLGVLGVARDVAAILDRPFAEPSARPVPAAHRETFPVELQAPAACPRFLGRVIRGIDPAAETPLWMRECLRRAGVRPISPAVDVTQYVMLELGQPMHAYDLDRLQGGIRVRQARPGEPLELLDGRRVELDTDMTVIADHARAVGLAGIMGGAATAVGEGTRKLLLECAWFAPEAISGRARRLGMQTDASYRFERGVDPAGQRRAMERATELLLAIAGGEAGPVTEARAAGHIPRRRPVRLSAERIRRLLGMELPAREVEGILARLGMRTRRRPDGWMVTPPSHRFDIEITEDLIEEIGRIHGYEHIPARQYPAEHPMEPVPEGRIGLARLRETLVQRGYHEAISYSFVDASLQRRLTGAGGLPLANPVTAGMSEMRLSLWPGLVQALMHNLNRQQSRVRIFESGLRFIPQGAEIKQEKIIAGLVSGPLYPLQWGAGQSPADFADLKGDVEALLALGGHRERAVFQPDEHPALHPGQAARILLDGSELGWLGRLHPAHRAALDLAQDALLFELRLEPLIAADLPAFAPISAYPSVRRDLAVVVDEAVPVGKLVAAARAAAGPRLVEARVFDVYRGPGVDSGRKSIALALILQDSSRTLTDEDADGILGAVADRLREAFKATLRE